jgi:hypothetical protein
MKSGLSIRTAGQALGLDKSKILRLKRHATFRGLLQAAHAEVLPPEVSHEAGVSGVSPFDAVSKKEETPAGGPRPPAVRSEAARVGNPEAASPCEALVPQAETPAAVLIPAVRSGCLLYLPNGSGSYTQCCRPVGANGYFCREHE